METTQFRNERPLLWQFRERTDIAPALEGEYDESRDLWTVTIAGHLTPLVATRLALATTTTMTKMKKDPTDND